MCAQVAEVEVDPESGEIKLRRFVTLHHTGKVLNPLLHDGQIDGSIVMGVGYALTEEMLFADGKVASLHFGDYKIPTIRGVSAAGKSRCRNFGGPRTLPEHEHRRNTDHHRCASNRERDPRRHRCQNKESADNRRKNSCGVKEVKIGT